ncbi:MAG: nuclear transport factor 2 family protein [Acidimicrobiia bacterium]|nr:nuclear transport factor 2 family protein [Acidimicrobiia bacterium]
MSDHTELMTAFKRAFSRGDSEALAGLLTDDFEWHMHWYPTDAPRSTGHVVKGVQGVVDEVAWRAANWSDVRFDAVSERVAGDLVVQTFTISGVDHHGKRFETDAVDLYRLVDGRLALKDTYWKQPTEAREDRG